MIGFQSGLTSYIPDQPPVMAALAMPGMRRVSRVSTSVVCSALGRSS